MVTPTTTSVLILGEKRVESTCDDLITHADYKFIRLANKGTEQIDKKIDEIRKTGATAFSTVVVIVPMNTDDDEMVNSDWIETKFTQIFAFVKLTLEMLMAQGKSGCLIFIQSCVGEIGHPQCVNSTSLAGACIGLMKSISKEVARHSISVNTISIGNCGTLGLAVTVDEHYTKMFEMTGLGGDINVNNVQQVLRCISSNSMAIQGQIIRLDAGMVM